MNQSLLNLELHSFNDINLFQKYEICRQQSQCYLLNPPPQPPILPKLIIINPSSTWIHSFFIIFGILITLISSCLLLFLLDVKFQFYHKLRQRYRQTNTTDKPSSFSSIVSTFYNSLTPLTTTTDQSSSLTMINKSNSRLQQHLNSDNRSFYHDHSINIYEEIGSSSDHYHYSHSLAYYELSPSKIICQNCLLETLHRKQQCLCHNFFVPIK